MVRDEKSALEWKYYSLIYLTSVFAVLTAQNSCNSHKIKYVGTWQIFSSSSSMLLTFFFLVRHQKRKKRGLVVVSNKTVIYLVQKVTMNLGSVKYVFSDLDFNEIANPRGLPIGSCLGRTK